MKRIETLLEELKLIYYEYDRSSNTLFADQKHLNGDAAMELVSITYMLQKNGIKYLIDNKKNGSGKLYPIFYSNLKRIFS